MAINLKKTNYNYENEIQKDIDYSRQMIRQKRIANKLAKIAKDIALISDTENLENITPDTIVNNILTNFYDYREIERLRIDVREINRHIENKLLTIYSTIKY